MPSSVLGVKLMNRELIKEVAAKYGLDVEGIYEDISASGIHLWHDDKVGLSFSMEQRYDEEYPSLIFGVYEKRREFSSRKSLLEYTPEQLAKIITSLGNDSYAVNKGFLGLGKEVNIRVFDTETNVELFNETLQQNKI